MDVDFVRKSVRAIGRCAIKVEQAAERCVSTLLDLIQTKVNYVVQEAIVVIKVRPFPTIITLFINQSSPCRASVRILYRAVFIAEQQLKVDFICCPNETSETWGNVFPSPCVDEVLFGIFQNSLNSNTVLLILQDIFRKYPNKYESIIATLCENLDTLDEPEAR